jgi:hypothetical protein
MTNTRLAAIPAPLDAIEVGGWDALPEVMRLFVTHRERINLAHGSLTIELGGVQSVSPTGEVTADRYKEAVILASEPAQCGGGFVRASVEDLDKAIAILTATRDRLAAQ